MSGYVYMLSILMGIVNIMFLIITYMLNVLLAFLLHGIELFITIRCFMVWFIVVVLGILYMSRDFVSFWCCLGQFWIISILNAVLNMLIMLMVSRDDVNVFLCRWNIICWFSAFFIGIIVVRGLVKVFGSWASLFG